MVSVRGHKKVEYLVEEGNNFVKKGDKYIPFKWQICLI